MRGKSRSGLITCLLTAAVFFLAIDDPARGEPYMRGDLRISFYAPPVIPHELRDDCLDCHADNGSDAPMIPHQRYDNCLQCHVFQQNVTLFRENSQTGVPEPVKSFPAYPGTPPVIPHRVFMRENCQACHGTDSRPDIINTPHPERLNCRQCHLPQSREVKLFRENRLQTINSGITVR